MRTLTLTDWVVSSRRQQLQGQEAERPGRQRWRCQQLPRLRVPLLHRVLQQDTHQRPRPEEHQPEEGTHDFKNRDAVEHLTTSDPHAGIVPLQQGFDRWERVLRLHRSIDPHQSPHCVRILEEKWYLPVKAKGWEIFMWHNYHRRLYAPQLSNYEVLEGMLRERRLPRPCPWVPLCPHKSCRHNAAFPDEHFFPSHILYLYFHLDQWDGHQINNLVDHGTNFSAP